jgi:hypothetical protein
MKKDVVNVLVEFNGGPAGSQGPPPGPPPGGGPPQPPPSMGTVVRQPGFGNVGLACFMVDTLPNNASDGDGRTTAVDNSKDSTGSLAAGEIAGISVAAFAGMLGLIAIIAAACFWRKRARISSLANDDIASDTDL